MYIYIICSFVNKNKIIIVIFCLNFPVPNQNVFNLFFADLSNKSY